MKSSDVQKEFGASIKALRKVEGLSQETLAERADLHRTYVSDVERGARNLSLQSIVRLADALEVSVSALFPPQLRSGKHTGVGKPGHRLESVDILLVEDNADDVEMTLHAFKKARFANRVHVVRDGAEALDYLFCRGLYSKRQASEGPEVILLDLNLPKVSGLEVLQIVKADPRTAATRVVILTGASDEMHITECRRLGADNYILKPVDFQGLSRATPKLNLDWALVHPAEILPALVSKT